MKWKFLSCTVLNGNKIHVHISIVSDAFTDRHMSQLLWAEVHHFLEETFHVGLGLPKNECIAWQLHKGFAEFEILKRSERAKI